WPGVSSRLTILPSYGNCITDEVTEMPRSFSSAIQSDVALRDVLRLFTEPAIWIAPPNSRSFSVSVVLPASGWLTMAKVRRRRVSWRWVGMEAGRLECEPTIVAWNWGGAWLLLPLPRQRRGSEMARV